jgi:hypothetical protein
MLSIFRLDRAKLGNKNLKTTPIPAKGQGHGLAALAGDENKERKSMIRAILKKGKIQPLDKLPKHWREGQELIVEGAEPSGNPADIKKWYAKLVALSAQIPAEDHQRMATAIAEQDREAKNQMGRDMGLN